MIGGLLKSASSTALFAALGLIALGSYAPAAKAADLGGDCCADLEERVAELEATTARKGNRRVSLTISGQVETAIMGWDNGFRSDTYIVDVPTVGGTYFQFAGSAKISPTLTAGFTIQVALDAGARSHQVNEVDDDGANAQAAGSKLQDGSGDTTMVMTLANWYLDDKRLGRVTVGRIVTSTGGVTGVDLAGTGVIANVNIGYWNRGFGATAGGPGGTTWSNLTGGNIMNGSTLSRANAIQYTSATVGGFSVSGSWGENDIWDAAVRYAGEHAGFRVAAAVGYAHNAGGLGDVTEDPGATGKDGPQPNLFKGSASIMHVPTGLYVQGAFVKEDPDNAKYHGDDPLLLYGQAGISKNWFGIGNTAIYGEYSNVSNPLAGTGSGGAALAIGGPDTNVWGIGVVQHIDAAAMEVFLAYRNYSSDFVATGGTEAAPTKLPVHDMDVVMGGARIRF